VVSYLEQRGQEGLQHYMTVDETGRLSRLFVEMEGACDEYALGGDDNVVLFDPTHGTSRYALKLCCFTTVSSAGQTIILAVAFLEKEDVFCFEWAFRCLMDVFKVSPPVFYSDADTAIGIAVNNLNVCNVWYGGWNTNTASFT
jgi:hypothetical protein